MTKSTNISRRIFCGGIFSYGAVEAAQPIIDINLKRKPIVDYSNEVELASLYAGPFFDIEPEVNLQNSTKPPHDAVDLLFDRSIDLNLLNTNTGENLSLSLVNGVSLSDVEKRKFDHFCRDWRQSKQVAMDKELLNTLGNICQNLSTGHGSLDVEILSGFRTEETNEMLRKKSPYVAKNSFHKRGKALDFRIPGISTSVVKKIADSVVRGGLGTYKNFIHVDTGPYRRWIS